MIDYKILITTSGVGSRLGDITKYTNKSLVRIGKRPALSYIIEAYDRSVPLVITVGYYGNQVEDFVKLAYPDRKIEIVKVDNYDGPGSSLGYSMLQAKDNLQCPFIYHAGDTIVKDTIPVPDRNFIASYKSDDTSQYASLNVVGEKVVHINDKGATDFNDIHIGLVGVNDYQSFWNKLEEVYSKDRNDSSLNDVSAINLMLREGKTFTHVPLKTWLDIGNTKALQNARESIVDRDALAVLDKLEESIFIFDDFVIKFFYDPKKIEDRVKRAEVLSGLTPEILDKKNNFYKYRYVKGDLFARVITPEIIKDFLSWTEQRMWQPVEEVSSEEFKAKCYEFYHDKTLQRIDKFLTENQIEDKEDIINNEKVPSIKELLDKVDFNWLSEAEQRIFHGDFILDNIIKTYDGYCLLDWRQNFAGLIKAGDQYYDLAKFNHNLTVNHDIIKDNLFTIEIKEDGSVYCDIMRRENLVASQKIYHKHLLNKGYDLKKIEILTAIIWLNMSPLHHHPFNLFLYYFGKLNLWRTINS